MLIDDEIRREILALEPLAPLHNAPALRAIADAEEAFPDLPHVAVFDTAFHETIPEEASVYAIPARWREEFGVRRYGFHGLSVEWSVERAAALLGRTGLRIVVCHLGGGCSVTAVVGRRSVDTTMGFSPLEGVPMNTRSGSIDPGAMLYLLREKVVGIDSLDHALNFDSGIEGLGGGSRGIARARGRSRGRRPSRDLGVRRFRASGSGCGRGDGGSRGRNRRSRLHGRHRRGLGACP